MTLTFEIPEARYSRLSARIATAAARAPKAGLPVPVLSRISARALEYTVKDALSHIRGGPGTRVVSVSMVTVGLDNFSPAIGDWSVVGYREAFRRKDREPLYSDSGDVPQNIRGTKLCCDHCGYSRARKTTFVVKNAESGTVSQVGSSCLEAFIGHSSGYVADLTELGSILREFEEAARRDIILSEEFLEEEVRTVLAVAFRRVSDDGFLGTAAARESGYTATWRHVEADLAACRSPDAREEDMKVTAADFMAADDIIASYAADGEDGGFRSAVRKAIGRGVANMRDVAVLTAAASLHAHDLQRDAERAKSKEAAATSANVGEKGQRIEFVGRVRNISSFAGQWGERCYVSIFDADGNLLLWKTNGGHGLDEGMAYEMKGTVKEHKICERGRYEGAAQTVLSRVVVLAGLGPASFERTDAASALTEEDAEALDGFLSGMTAF